MSNSKLTDEEESSVIYNRCFWYAFVANLLLVTANTMTYRFAEFVRHLGGTEEITGQLIAAGLIGSLIWRFFLGQAMDRYGIFAVWTVSTGLYLIGSLLMIFSDEVGPYILVARVLLTIGIASMFAVALSHVQGLAPPNRRTEIIATYGAAGFIGMITGAQLGDLLFSLVPNGSVLYPILFTTTTVLGVGHGVLGAWMTHASPPPPKTKSLPVHRLIRQYWPWRIVSVTFMMGLVLTVTTIFITRYASHLGFGGVRLFFSAYAITAFTTRIIARQWNRTQGRHRLIVYGLASHALGILLLLQVHQEWQFAFPAICFGFGQALTFPCVVSLGTSAFPEEYRGTGTTLCLAAIDFGTMVTAPAVGWMIDHHGFTPMLLVTATTVSVVTATYAVRNWKTVDGDMQASPASHRMVPEAIPAKPVAATAARPTRRDMRSQPSMTKAG